MTPEEEALHNLQDIVSLNPAGFDFEYTVFKTAGGTLERRLSCAGKVLRPEDIAVVIRNSDALL